MLTEFESRLADVLGSRLPAPFGGRVRRRGAPAPNGPGPVVTVGIDALEPLEPDFGSVRPEIVAGSDDQRRIVRLGVTVAIGIEPRNASDRLEELAGIDAVVYELQHPEMRSAEAFVAPGDQGFLVEHLHLGASDLGVDGELVVTAVGWFWPVGVAGDTGLPIDRALVREFRLPMQLAYDAPVEAGGPGVALELTLGATGTLEVAAGETAVAPFGSLALRLVDAGGGPGAGVLSGGSAGPDGTHIVAVGGGSATVTYEPPGSPLTEQLVVAAFARDDDGNERIGIELARFDVVVSP